MTTKAKSSLAALALLATLGLGASGAAQAHGDDIFWSIGMSQPGIRIGVSNGPVVVPAPYPVVVQPRVVYSPPPVYYPPPVYRVVYPGHYEHERGYGHGHGHWRDRDERWEGRRGGREQFRGGERYEGRGHEQGRGFGGGPRPGTEGHMGNRR